MGARSDEPGALLLIGGATAVWLALLLSFVGTFRLARVVSEPAVSQVLMVLLLAVATLLLGILVGMSAASPREDVSRGRAGGWAGDQRRIASPHSQPHL
ncbi:MAG TPA: hypothetical protein VMV93_07795 [Chloroflexota bacterium]|nr:hypothetical protein [Chloroflexota bacterium]